MTAAPSYTEIGYPLTPLLFCGGCASMLWSSLTYVYSHELGGLNAAWIGLAVLGLGGLILACLPRHGGDGARSPGA